MANVGLDPVATHTPPAEASQRDTLLAQRFPLALIAPASHYFLNTTFPNIAEHAAREGPPAIVLHPADAAGRVYNDRGEFCATVAVSDRVCPGVAGGRKGFWPKRIAGAASANATVAERDADMGGGAVFHDNRVEVELSSPGSLR